MPQLSGISQILSGDSGDIHTTQMHKFGTRAVDVDGNVWIYLKGVASTVLGSWVTYDELGVTTLLVANAKGFVAVAGAILDATTDFGWYCIFGEVEASLAANCGADALIGYEAASGAAGDGYAAGDMIYGAMIRDATTTAAIATVQISYPFVTDEST